MILTIDGYDGTGKSTLSYGLCGRYGFEYLDKPHILKHMVEHGCSYEQALKETSVIEHELFKSKDSRAIAEYYLSAIYWLQQFQTECNLVLDRGVLTTYAVVGNDETKDIFKKYISLGAFYDASVYLKADDYERVRRIRANNPDDEDLNHPVKWHENDLEQFADSMNLNYFPIVTDGKTPDQVYRDAIFYIDGEVEFGAVENPKSLKKIIRG